MTMAGLCYSGKRKERGVRGIGGELREHGQRERKWCEEMEERKKEGREGNTSGSDVIVPVTLAGLRGSGKRRVGGRKGGEREWNRTDGTVVCMLLVTVCESGERAESQGLTE